LKSAEAFPLLMPVTALDLESATVASEQRGKLLGDGDPKMALVFFSGT